MKATNAFLFLRRFYRAQRLGVFFPGTARFSFPSRFRLCGRDMTLSSPAEKGIASDFINVLLDDEYGLRKLPRAPRTILDAGANIGLFSLWARHNFPAAVIHAYEPNPRAFQHARVNLEGTGVQAFQAALGPVRGRASIVDKWESRWASTTADDHGDVRVVTLGDAVASIGGSVDLLKMDVEGAEWGLFEDGSAFTGIGTVRMEYHLLPSQTLQDLESAVKRIGFRLDRVISKDKIGLAWFSRSA